MTAVLEETVGIEGFVNAVDRTENLEIHDSELTDDGDAIIIRNTAIDEGISGAYVRVSVEEVDRVPAHQVIGCIQNERKPIMCHGITRIVGYYSRTNNWNKSKLGELRDRDQANYTVGSHKAEFDDQRHRAINGLG